MKNRYALIKKTCVLLLVLVLLPLCHAQAAPDAPGAAPAVRGQQNFDSALAQLRMTPSGFTEVDHRDVIQFVNASKGIVVLATKPNHPAHPAMVKRQVVKDAKGELGIRMTSTGTGNKQALKTWVDALAAQDKLAVDQKPAR